MSDQEEFLISDEEQHQHEYDQSEIWVTTESMNHTQTSSIEADPTEPAAGNLSRGKYFRKYSPQQLALAVESVRSGARTCFDASKHFKVPSTTIRDHLNDKHTLQHGKAPILSPKDEADLADWILECAAMGDPRTPSQVRAAASKLAALSPDPSRHLGKKEASRAWLKLFLKRNPQVCLRKPQAITRASANVNPENIRNFFQIVHKFFEDNNLLHVLESPNSLGNLDETGYERNITARTVLTGPAAHAYRAETANPKEITTVVNTILASGVALKPVIIFKKSLSQMADIARACGEAGADFVLQQTEKGWQSQKSFYEYVSKQLVSELDALGVERSPTLPFVLFLDNHPSHRSLELFKFCRENYIVLITFFPNSTHILQPLDVGIFGGAKSAWRAAVERWREIPGNRDLRNSDFIKLLKEVQDKAFSPEAIKSAFVKSGIFPFGDQNVDLIRCVGKAPTQQRSEESHDDGTENRAEQHDGPTFMFDENARDGFDDTNQDEIDDYSPTSTSCTPISISNESPEQSESSAASTAMRKVAMYLSLAQEQINSADDYYKKPEVNDQGKSQIISLLRQTATCLQQQLTVLIGSPNDHQLQSQVPKPLKKTILQTPEPFARKLQTRRYKLPNYGPMTSDQVIADLQQLEESRKKTEEDKELRKVEREKKREIAETVRRIKKEKAGTRKQTAASSTQPRKPGRPATCTAEIVQDENEENDEPTKKQAKKRGRPKKSEPIDTMQNDEDSWKPHRTRRHMYQRDSNAQLPVKRGRRSKQQPKDDLGEDDVNEDSEEEPREGDDYFRTTKIVL